MFKYYLGQFVIGIFSWRIFDLPKIRVIKFKVLPLVLGIRNAVNFGYGVHIYRPHLLKSGGEISIGKNCYIRENTTLDFTGNLIIGNKVTISEGAKIYSHDHDPIKLGKRLSEEEHVKVEETIIKNGAWIGAASVVLGGVTVGENSVVGAGSVVTHDVPDNTIVAGNPAKAIRLLNV